jgi:hypothetical protein
MNVTSLFYQPTIHYSTGLFYQFSPKKKRPLHRDRLPSSNLTYVLIYQIILAVTRLP